MKSVHQIAQQILDDWPYASQIKSAHKSLLVAMIAEALLKPRIYLTANGLTYKINDKLIGFEE